MGSYAKSGVDIDRGNHFVERLKNLCPEIGGFSGLYPYGDQYLVASCDGVGTKLKLAFEMNQHETIGIDLVAMCVNDVITTGARPLFLLDYLASSRIDVDQAETILHGIIEGCKEAECILLGGETAEMPGFYQEKEYDMAGFAVGILPKKKLIDGKEIQEKDLLVGIVSTGVHSNGFSLVRKILKDSQTSLLEKIPQSDKTIGEILLTPTRIYVKTIFDILKNFKIKGLAHITGGGLLENVPRFLPEGKRAYICKNNWEVPPIFKWLQERGDIAEDEMYRVFNMGIGMVAALEEGDAHKLVASRKDCIVIGEIRNADVGVEWM
ncbi:MAG TPA: phosphoribosylformylglycinamidine cyclo-ligase [Rhabdochlamydiaceae bacterium]|nr:phosphoribosylformylglycinamidine cyclo-ligase [Rhabdochlamydiaceae bacterium]